MNDRQRERFLDEVHRQSGTLGKRIPETLTVQGEAIDLNAFVFECKRLDTVPESECDRIEEVKRRLKRERLERIHRIERDEISCEEGERLVESIRGIDRAYNALDGLDSPKIGEEIRQEKLDDARELMALVRLGQ